MLSEVRRKQPFHGNVGTCERPLHGRHGAAPRLSGRVCAGICRGDPRVGLRGAACSGLAWAAAAKAPAVADPPTSRPAGPTQDGRSPPRTPHRPGGPGASLQELARSGAHVLGLHRECEVPDVLIQPNTSALLRSSPSPGGLPGLGVRSPLTSFPASSVLSFPGRCGHCLSLGDEGII